MAIPGLHNLPPHYKGDTRSGRLYIIYQDDGITPEDLTNVTIRMAFHKDSPTGPEMDVLTIGDGLSLTDPVQGQLTCDKRLLPIFDVGLYHYDMELTFPDGTVRTYLKGTMDVQQDVS